MQQALVYLYIPSMHVQRQYTVHVHVLYHPYTLSN